MTQQSWVTPGGIDLVTALEVCGPNSINLLKVSMGK